jgi:hypothetical protein
MIDATELGEYLATAIKQAKPKPLGNVKTVKADRRDYWLSAMAGLAVNEQEEKPHVLPTIFHTTASEAGYVEPSLTEAMKIIKANARPACFPAYNWGGFKL